MQEASAADGFLRRKIIQPLLTMLRTGATPEKLALSIAVGLAIGVCPLVGATTILCTIAALGMGLNLPAIQLANYLAYAVQLALLLPFNRLGAWLIGAPPLPLSVDQILNLVQTSAWNALTLLWSALLHALVAWSLLGPLTGVALYFLLRPMLRRMARKFGLAREAA
jgi:hypothetical protein